MVTAEVRVSAQPTSWLFTTAHPSRKPTWTPINVTPSGLHGNRLTCGIHLHTHKHSTYHIHTQINTQKTHNIHTHTPHTTHAPCTTPHTYTHAYTRTKKQGEIQWCNLLKLTLTSSFHVCLHTHPHACMHSCTGTTHRQSTWNKHVKEQQKLL